MPIVMFIPYTGTTVFKNVEPAKQSYILGRLIEGYIDQQKGISHNYNAKCDRCFDLWRRFLQACGIADEFIEEFT